MLAQKQSVKPEAGQGRRQFLTRLVLFTCAVLLPLLITMSRVEAASYINIDGASNVNFGTWVNSGSYSSSQNLCIASANTTSWIPWRGSQMRDYRIKINSLDSASGLYLYKDGNSAAGGNQRIAVTFRHRDLIGSGGTEELFANQFDQFENSGQFFYCVFFGGDNARLEVELPASQLNAAVSGSYSGRFQLLADNGGATDTQSFEVSVQVEGGSDVRISGLDDIDLGRYGGASTGDISATESFCVYSSNSAYRLSVSSLNQNGSGDFYLASSQTDDIIPMDLRFADSASAVTGTPVGNQSLSGMGDASAEDCGGRDNASLNFRIMEEDLRASSSGAYSNTVILLVEPE